MSISIAPLSTFVHKCNEWHVSSTFKIKLFSKKVPKTFSQSGKFYPCLNIMRGVMFAKMEFPGFVDKLQQQLQRYPVIPIGKLQIEVLETVALNDIATVREIIEACRKIGIGFALDDFGTGYSSLSYLSGLPIDTIKIDQSFVRGMLEDKGDMAIVQGIIALARAFDRQTVAEGIETKDQYQVLLDMGCELGQGYGIARPMPADKLIDWHSTLDFVPR